MNDGLLRQYIHICLYVHLSPALASAALQELGYSAAEVAAALKGVDPKATTEEMVRYGLRQMVMKG